MLFNQPSDVRKFLVDTLKIKQKQGSAASLGENYTRNEWGRFKSTLQTSGEDVKLQLCSPMVSLTAFFKFLIYWTKGLSPKSRWKTTLVSSEKDLNYTRFEWKRCSLHSFRVKKMFTTLVSSEKDVNYTRFEWKRCELHSFRVKKMWTTLVSSEKDVNYTRFECV